MIVIDFETRSRVDLLKCGASVYARGESTEVLCLGILTGNGAIVWKAGNPDPTFLLKAIEKGELIHAHNVGFERAIWTHICHKRMGWPDVAFDQWRCSLAACSRLALPRSLAGAGAAVGLSMPKDEQGHKVMLRLCKPKKPSKADPGEWDNSPEKFAILYDYCKRDIEAEAELFETIDPLTDSELKVWQLDQKINLRGIPIDRPAVENALVIVDEAHARSCKRLAELTDGAVQTPKQTGRMTTWLAEQGVDVPDLRAGTVAEFLEKDLPVNVREFLTIRRDLGKASTGKLEAMLKRCDEDNRVRGSMVYHGASTGRWAGAGIQIQNFPRGSFGGTKDDPKLGQVQIDTVHRLLPSLEPDLLELLIGPALDCISSLLRSFIKAEPGKRFLVSDFASIEARVLAWVAGQEDLLDSFRAGEDIYKGMASDIYEIEVNDVDKSQRQMGKVAILGLGYGMGPGDRRGGGFVGACKNMAGVVISKKFGKQVVKAYRKKYSRIPAFWGEIQTACIRAIETGKTHFAGRVMAFVEGDYLKIRLPSGRDLHYREPEIVEVRAPWSEGAVGCIKAPEADREWLSEVLDVEAGDYKNGWFTDCRVPKGMTLALRDRYGMVALKLEAREPQLIKQIQFKGTVGPARKWKNDRTYGGKLCLAEGTKVLTSNGWKSIERVDQHDLVFDGVDWVSHEGVILQGYQNTIEAWGVSMTPDHRVLTTEGWRCASQLEGLTWQNVRIPDGCQICGVEREEELLGGPLQMRKAQSARLQRYHTEKRGSNSFLRVHEENVNLESQHSARHVGSSSVCRVGLNAGPMQQPQSQVVQGLRGKGYQGLPTLEQVPELLGGHGAHLSARFVTGQDQQREWVHARQLSLGHMGGAGQQQESRPAIQPVEGRGEDSGRTFGRERHLSRDDLLPTQTRLAGFGTSENSRLHQPTFDILNAGPRRRFVVMGDEAPFLSHNCENVVQAVARDFLVEAMLRLDAKGYGIIATVHDEVISEDAEDFGSLEEFDHIMAQVPTWGRGCPIAVEGYEAEKYRK